MSNTDIIKMYKEGYSIDFIVDKYYKFINRNVQENRNFNGNIIIYQKKIKKDEARLYISKVIYEYIMEIFKEET